MQDDIHNALLEKGVDWRQARYKTERYGMLFAKPLHLTVEEDRISGVE
jgi:hypothetical protein